MTKKIHSVALLAFFIVIGFGCKTKQEVAEISGAQIRAVKPAQELVEPPKTVTELPKTVTPPVVETPVVVVPPVVTVAEVTRKETFKPVAADSAIAIEAMKFKYHVVVGSFSIQDNAKGLQAKLISEGNKPVIVVNEQGMFRLLIASYNEYLQAREHINRINTRFTDAWVLVQKQ